MPTDHTDERRSTRPPKKGRKAEPTCLGHVSRREAMRQRMPTFGARELLSGDRRLPIACRSAVIQRFHVVLSVRIFASLRGGWSGGLAVLCGSKMSGWAGSALSALSMGSIGREGGFVRPSCLCVFVVATDSKDSLCVFPVPLCLCGLSRYFDRRSRSSRVFGQSALRRRESERSARMRPPVWQPAQ